jgi:AraC-like DNA-binding protein
MSTLSTSIANAILCAISTSNEELENIALAIGLDSAQLRDPEAHVNYDQYVAIWSEVIRRTGDTYIGLHAAERVSNEQLGVVAHACLLCSNLGQALDLFLRYSRLTNDALDIHIEHADDEVRLSFDLGFSPWALPRPEVEFVLAVTCHSISRALGRKIHPIEARFRHTEPPKLGEYKRTFGNNLVFGHRTNELVFPSALLEESSSISDPAACADMEKRFAEMIKKLSPADPLIEKLRWTVFNALGVGDVSFQSISRRMNISAAKLRKELASRKTSFRFLVNAIRRDIALVYLEDRSWSLADVAFVLGFSDTSSFNRSFRGWTGETPTEYRRFFFGDPE